MSLNAWLSSATSAAWRSTTIRRPGASGSTRRISAVSCSSGRNTRRSASRLTASTSATPTPSTATSPPSIRELTVAGDSASTATAATRTAALMANTRQKSDTAS